jgi:hypothetical protein
MFALANERSHPPTNKEMAVIIRITQANPLKAERYVLVHEETSYGI